MLPEGVGSGLKAGEVALNVGTSEELRQDSIESGTVRLHDEGRLSTSVKLTTVSVDILLTWQKQGADSLDARSVARGSQQLGPGVVVLLSSM